MKINYDNIPKQTCETLVNYIEHGIPPGGFVTALLANDLFEACGRADAWNQMSLLNIVSWVYNYAPRGCWGSYEKVKNWIEAHEKMRKEDREDNHAR